MAEAVGPAAARVLVAVADVSGLVPKGSATDEHARANTTSVYTVPAVFPMLPERLSTDLTSLVEDEDRRAVVVDMVVDADGRVCESDVYCALVKNHAKLAYDPVAAWLDGRAPAPPGVSGAPALGEPIVLQERVAQAMRRQRRQRGALTLETAGERPVWAGDRLVDLRHDEKNRAKALIEELMIGANGVVASYLERAGLPSLRRVLRSPARWDRIVSLAAAVGEELPPAPDAPALERFLTRRRAAAPAAFPELSLSVVKLLGAGRYAVGLPSELSHDHFGLAVRDYTHSTAPNRRYPDLVTQRMLKAAIAARPCPYDELALSALAEHCTRQEDNAAKVERQVRKSAAALLLSTQAGRRFRAVVTGASPKGTWVRISTPVAEGKLVGSTDGLDVGDHLSVELVDADVEQGRIDFRRG